MGFGPARNDDAEDFVSAPSDGDATPRLQWPAWDIRAATCCGHPAAPRTPDPFEDFDCNGAAGTTAITSTHLFPLLVPPLERNAGMDAGCIQDDGLACPEPINHPEAAHHHLEQADAAYFDTLFPVDPCAIAGAQDIFMLARHVEEAGSDSELS